MKKLFLVLIMLLVVTISSIDAKASYEWLDATTYEDCNPEQGGCPVVEMRSDTQLVFQLGDTEPNWENYFRIYDVEDGIVTTWSIYENINTATIGAYSIMVEGCDNDLNYVRAEIVVLVEERH